MRQLGSDLKFGAGNQPFVIRDLPDRQRRMLNMIFNI